MIRRILHPSDFSKASRPAFAKALELAKQNRAQLIVAYAMPSIVPVADGYMSPAVYEEIAVSNRRYGAKHLTALVTKAKRAGVRAKALLLDGPPAERIVRAARGQRADLIVMGTHGHTGFTRLVLGSVAGRVVSHARCPVLTVRGR
jgi:nucleotide-binding universal stress UspA family protein